MSTTTQGSQPKPSDARGKDAADGNAARSEARSRWMYSGRQLARSARRAKLQYLILWAGILVLTFFYESTPANGIIWCPFRLLTGAECGGCGMTRSWVALSSGELTPAMAFNPFGPLLYGMAVLKTGLLGWEVAAGREFRFPLWERIRPWAFSLLTAALVGFSIYRLSAVL